MVADRPVARPGISYYKNERSSRALGMVGWGGTFNHSKHRSKFRVELRAVGTPSGLGAGSLYLPSNERQTMARWEMRIGLGQVVVLWSVLAGIMICVFVFGYHAGRERGWKKALEEGGGAQTVRLPITAVKLD